MINALNSEIEFLRKDVLSKDTIIKLLITDNNKSIEVKTRESSKQSDKSIESNLIDRRKKNDNFVNKKDDSNDIRKKVVNDNTRYEKIANEFKPVKKGKEHLRTVSIIGDSMLKDVKGYNMKKNLPSNTKVYVRSNSGATTEDMFDYANPTKKFKPDLYIVHCGTNDLRSKKDPSEIANNIVKLASDLKDDDNDVAISSIIHRNDDLNNIGNKVNYFLKIKSSASNLGFIEHTNITNFHLNHSRLHLTSNGANILAENFVNYIQL